MRARQRDADARLGETEAAHDASALRIVLRAVERVGECADEEHGVARGQHGVSIERDDVSHTTNRGRVALDDGERTIGPAEYELIELSELAALPLPTHPHALL